MPRLWVVVAAKMAELYKPGDVVDIGDGKQAKVKSVDLPNDLVELDVDAAPEGGMVGAKYKMPGEVKIPLKKV